MKMNNTKENPYWDSETKRFKPGNPGKPKGAVSYRTRFLMTMLDCWGERQNQILRKMMTKPDAQFLRALDRIIRVYGISSKAQEAHAQELPPYIIHIESEGVKTQ